MTVDSNDEKNVSARRIAVNNALIWALINLIIFLLVFYAMPSLMGNFAWGFLQLAIAIGLAVYFTLDIRKKIGGYWTFREALGNIFLMFIVQVVVVTLATTVFAKWIEPTYADTVREITLNATTRMAESISSDQEVIDKIIADAEESIEKQVNPGLMDLVKGLSIAAILYFIGALIFAAIFKRNPPMFAPITDEEASSDSENDQV